MKMNEITRCLKDYKFKSIFLKNLRMLLLLILIPLMGIVSLTYYSYERIERKNRETFYHEEVMKAMFDVDRCFQEAKNQMMYVVHNQSTELFFYLDANDINAYDNISRTNELIQMSVVNNNFIRDLCIYSAEHKQVLSGQGVSLAEHYQYRDCLTNADTVTSGELRLSQSGLAYPKQLISLYYKFDFGNTRKGLGITSIDPEMLLKEISVRLPEVSLTLKGGILASSDQAQTGQSVPEWMAQASQSKKEFFIHDNKQYLRTVSPRFGYEMFAEMDRELYAAHSAGMDGWMLTLLFFMLGLTVLLCFYFSKQIFSPIQSIFSLLEKNRMLLTGEEILRAEDEIKYIETTIQRTIFKAEDVDKELNERIRKLKKVQAQALQSQINPHFVNNTLDHIKWYSITKLGSENEIVEIAEALSG
ncbi:MAG: histidine kinase, partial [Ruthenibacterium sp.]